MKAPLKIEWPDQPALRDDDRFMLLINSVNKLHRQNQRLARWRAVWFAAFAVTLYVLICVLNAR